MTLVRIKSGVDKIVEWSLVLIFTVMTLNVLWQVFTRFVMGSPSSYTEELARYLLMWLGLLGAGYGVGKKLHLAIDLLPMKLKGRPRVILEIVIQACILLFAFVVVLIGGANLVGITLSLHQISAALQVKLGYVYLVLPLSGALMMFYSGLAVYENAKSLRSHS